MGSGYVMQPESEVDSRVLPSKLPGRSADQPVGTPVNRHKPPATRQLA